MLIKPLELLTFLVLSCCAQEQLTCLRSSTPTTGSSAFNNDVTRERLQGAPGKKGPIGARGQRGEKGEKGDPGIPDNSLVEELRDQISTLERQRESKFSAFRTGFQRLDDGWIGLFNGYQYKVSSTKQNYATNKAFCRRNGAKLAVYGIQDMGNRRIIQRASNFQEFVHIGMNDIDVEGTWIWNNRQRATDEVALWRNGQPDGGNGEDCAIMHFQTLLTYDHPCSHEHYALCEKRWE